MRYFNALALGGKHHRMLAHDIARADCLKEASYGRIIEHSYGRVHTVPGTVFRDTLKDGGEGPEMVVLPTGSFQVGSPDIETDRDSDEGPVRTVNISKRLGHGP